MAGKGKGHKDFNWDDGTSDDDVIPGSNAPDLIDAGDGDDTVAGGNQHDAVFGGPGDDTVTGDNGKDVAGGDAGNDDVSGNNGKDYVDGGAGSDLVSGNNGKDILIGGPGADDDEPTIHEGGEVDFSNPFFGFNVISGDNGKDTIVSSSESGFYDYGGWVVAGSSDIMTGGRGHDTFVFLEGHGNDVITDFDKDRIELSDLDLKHGFDDLTIADDGFGNAIIDTGEGTITLIGLAAEDISASDFAF